MFDLGNFLKKKWDTSVVRDAVSSNTAADQQRRQVSAQKAAPVQQPKVPYYGSFSPQVTNQDQAVQQTGRDLGRQQREGQITGQQFTDKFSQLLASTTKDSGYKTPMAQAGNFAKSIVKPFWETGDTVVKGAQLGVANATNNTQAADNARLRRDQSYAESLVQPVSRAASGINSTFNQAQKSAERQLENKLVELRNNTETFTQNKAKEIQDGIRSGIYDPQKGSEAIQELLSLNEGVNGKLGQFYDEKLATVGLTKDMSAAQSYAQIAGDQLNAAGLLISPASGTAIRQAGGNVIRRGVSELGTNSVLNALGGASSAYGQGADLEEALKAGATQAGVGALMMGAGYLKGLKGPAAVETNIPAAPNSLREQIQVAKNNVRLAINNPDEANVFKVNNPLDAKTTGLDINNPMGAQTRPLEIRNPLGAETGKKLSIMDRYRQATDIDAPNQDGALFPKNDAPQVGKTPLQISEEAHQAKLKANNLTQNEYAGLHQNVTDLENRASELHKATSDALDAAPRNAKGELTPQGKAGVTKALDEWTKAQEAHVTALNKVRVIDGQEPIVLGNRTPAPQVGKTDPLESLKQEAIYTNFNGKKGTVVGEKDGYILVKPEFGTSTELYTKDQFDRIMSKQNEFVEDAKKTEVRQAESVKQEQAKQQEIEAVKQRREALVDYSGTNPMQKGRIDKMLSKKVNVWGKEGTLDEVIAAHNPTNKYKIGGEYVIDATDGVNSGIMALPKTVWDRLKVPEMSRDAFGKKTPVRKATTNPAPTTRENAILPRVGDTPLPIKQDVVIGDTAPLKKGNTRPDPLTTVSGRKIQLDQYNPNAKSSAADSRINTKWNQTLIEAAIEEAKLRNDSMNLGIFEDMQGTSYKNLSESDMSGIHQYLFDSPDSIKLTYNQTQKEYNSSELAEPKKGKAIEAERWQDQPERVKPSSANPRATQSQPPKSPLTVEKKPFTPISQPVDNIPAIAKRVTASDSTGQLRSAADKNLVRLSKQEQLPPQISRTEVQAKSSQSLQNDSLANGTTKVKLNTNRLKVGEEAMARLDKDTQETITKMSNQDIQRVAKDAGIDTRTYTDEQVRTKIAEQLNVRQDAVRLQNEADAAFKAGDFKTAEEKLSRSAAMGRVSREQGTDLARQLQARRIIANELDTPQQRMFKLLDNAGVNPEVYTKRLARVDFTNPQDVVKAYRELVPPKASEWLDTVRYNSMLSSPLTHLVNAASNAINIGVIAPLEKTLRGVADATGGLFGKERKYAAGEGAAYAKGSASNIKKAAGEFLDVMRGIDRTQNLDLQEYSTPLAIGGVKGATYQTLSFPMKMLGASDKFFRTLAEGGETAALNLRESKGIKLGGNKRALAEAEGAYRLYQQDTNLKGQGGVLQSIDSVTNSIMKLRKDHTWARFVFPFVKTPTNILKQGVEFSPLGFANAVTAADKTTALTRAAIGTAVFGASAAALGAGDLTWGTPTNKEARDRFLAEGKQPYAIRIGGKWVSFAKLPPAVSFPLALTAGIDDAIKQKKMSESTADAIMEGVAKWGQFLGDQSYVKNIGDTLAAFKGDADRATQAVANYPQQVVPFRALTGWIARMTDDTERKVDADKGQIEKQVQSLLLNYPGLRQKIGTRDYRGRPIPANNPVLNSFSPFKITDQRAPNAVDAELDATKAAPKTSALTPKQTSEIEKLAKAKTNEYQNQLIQSDEYKALSSDDKRKRLASLAEDVKAVESRKYQNKYSIGERALDFTGKETVLTKNQVALLQNSDLSAYKSSTSTPKTKVQSDYEVASSNRDLTMTRAKANNDLNAWNTAAAEEYDALGQQIKALDPKTDQVKINTLIKKQEALQRTALGYKANGYIKKTTTKKTGKGSKGGKFTIPTTSVASSARTSTFTNLNRLLAGTTKTNSNKGKIGNKVALRKITVKGKS